MFVPSLASSLLEKKRKPGAPCVAVMFSCDLRRRRQQMANDHAANTAIAFKDLDGQMIGAHFELYRL